MYLDAFGLTNLFSCTLYVGDHNGDVSHVVIVVCKDAGGVVLLAGLVVAVELVL